MHEVIVIDDSDDEDLKQAIALSLEFEADEKSRAAAEARQDVDDEDEDIKRAIALSLQTDHRPAMSVNQRSESVDRSDAVSRPAPGSQSIQGLDRRKMEEERLSRLSKKRQATPNVGASSMQAIEPLEKKLKTDHPPLTQEKPALQYPHGKTWSPVHPRGGDIKIEELLDADRVKLAIVCSYMWDLEWFFAKFPKRQARLLFIMDARTDAERAQRDLEARTVGGGLIGVCYPPMGDGARMIHSKFILVVYENFLRLVVTSANLTPYDWGETGVLENVVFVIDLPRLASDEEEMMTFFSRELLHFLTASNLPAGSLKSLLRFDFSATKNIGFVHSM
jgi:hypothetical protein